MKLKHAVIAGAVFFNSIASAAIVSVFVEDFARFGAVTGAGSYLHYANSSEHGGFSGWTVNDVDIVNDDFGAIVPASSNIFGVTDSVSLDLNGNGPGSISRTFSTFVGSTYLVGFQVGANGLGAEFNVTVAGINRLLVPGPYNSSGLARNVTISFLATTSSATLTFTGRGSSNQGAVLDNITVFTLDAPDNPPTGNVPVPGLLGLAALGLAGVAFQRRKPALNAI